MIIAGTGHRPKKLGGYEDEIFNRLVKFCEAELRRLSPKKVISGMAIGFDQALAQAAVNLDIPYIAAVPFRGQESKWPGKAVIFYHKLLKQAERVVYVSPGGFAAYKMHLRNGWMVDNCNLLLTLWDGIPSGGTYSCTEYAQQVDRAMVNAWERWVEFKKGA